MIQCFGLTWVSIFLWTLVEKFYFVLLIVNCPWLGLVPYVQWKNESLNFVLDKILLSASNFLVNIWNIFWVLKCSSMKGQHNNSKQIESVLNDQFCKYKFSWISILSILVYPPHFQLLGFIERQLEYSRYSHNIILVEVAINELFIWMLSHQKLNEIWVVWQWIGQQVSTKSCF